MHSELAVVILNYNGEQYLQQFLPSVLAYSQGHRVIIADNGSTDGSVSMLKEKFPEAELLLLKANYGYAGGYNQALKQIAARYYLLLNSDVEVTAGWLAPMLQLLNAHPEIAACQPKILSYHQPDFFEYAGAAGGYLDFLGYPFCRGRILDSLEKDLGQYDSTVPIFWASGACLMVRSEVFHQLEGFDAGFFAHMEEIDFCWRVHQAGLQVYACPDSRVYHVGGGTLPKNNPRKTLLNFRNGLWMLCKNSSFYELLWKIPIRLGLDWLAMLMFILKRQFQDAGAVPKAHFQLLLKAPHIQRERSKKKKKQDNKAPLYKGSILVDYYLNKNKTYKELDPKRIKLKKVQKVT